MIPRRTRDQISRPAKYREAQEEPSNKKQPY